MRAPREIEDQPAFDRSEGEVAALARAAHRLVMIEQPAHLGGREIGIEEEAGARLHLRFVPLIL